MIHHIKHHGFPFVFDDDTITFFLVPGDFKKFKPPEKKRVKRKSKSLKRIAIVNLENTTGCNLACAYCFAAKKHLQNRKMSYPVLKKTIEYFSKYFKSLSPPVRELYLDFTGTGEPLLNFELIKQTADYLLATQKRKTYLRFTSNGTLFNNKNIKSIKELSKKRSRLLRFSLSMDGPPLVSALTRQSRGGAEVGDLILKNIRRLKKQRIFDLIDNVNATFTFDRPLLLLRLVGLYHLGFKEIIIKPYRGQDKKFKITKARLLKVKQEYHELISFLLEKIINNRNYTYLSAILNPGDFLGRFLLRVFKHSAQVRRCSAGDLSFFVDCGGKIFFCPSFGDAKNNSLGDVFKGFKTKSLARAREATGLLKACQKCWAQKICGGECPHETYIRGQSRPNELLCELKKFLIKEAAYFWAVLQMENKKAVRTIEAYLRRKKSVYFE